MTYVVGEQCIKYMDCVEVCPVDCFHKGKNVLVIDPEECIDCALCEPECPIGAIYPGDELAASEEYIREVNLEFSRKWTVITAMGEAPLDAREWVDVPNKYALHFSARSGLDPDR